MGAKIQISESAVAARVQGAWNRGLRALANQVKLDCNQYVKIDTHAMEASADTHSQLDRGLVIWQTPYAKRQYWEIKTSLTAGRTWKWCETAKRKHLDDWKRIAQKGLEENL